MSLKPGFVVFEATAGDVTAEDNTDDTVLVVEAFATVVVAVVVAVIVTVGVDDAESCAAR